MVFRDDEIVDAKADHRPSQPCFHGNVGIDFRELHGVDSVHVHEKPGVQGGGVREEDDPAQVEIHAEHLPVGRGGLLDQALRMAAHVAEAGPDLLLDVALPDAVGVGDEQLPVRSEGDAFRAGQNAVTE